MERLGVRCRPHPIDRGDSLLGVNHVSLRLSLITLRSCCMLFRRLMRIFVIERVYLA
jgi:hypothetical protein